MILAILMLGIFPIVMIPGKLGNSSLTNFSLVIHQEGSLSGCHIMAVSVLDLQVATSATSSISLNTERKIQENGPFQNEMSYDSSESVQKLESTSNLINKNPNPILNYIPIITNRNPNLFSIKIKYTVCNLSSSPSFFSVSIKVYTCFEIG